MRVHWKNITGYCCALMFLLFSCDSDVKKEEEQISGIVYRTKFLNPDGTLNAILNLDSNRKKHGNSKYYYKNGTLKSSSNYYHGKRHGKTILYDSNGKFTDSLYFQYGKLNGIQTVITDERYKYVKPFRDGKIHGVQRCYHPDGYLYETMTYVHDKILGEYIGYHPSGKIRFYRYFTHPSMLGYEQFYDNNGTPSERVGRLTQFFDFDDAPECPGDTGLITFRLLGQEVFNPKLKIYEATDDNLEILETSIDGDSVTCKLSKLKNLDSELHIVTKKFLDGKNFETDTFFFSMPKWDCE